MPALTPSDPIPFDVSVTESMHRLEVDRIYRTLFDVPAPEVVTDRFLHPSSVINGRAVTRDIERYYRALEHTGDLEALELAARYTRRLPLISQKFRLVVHLAETLPENQHHFVNRRQSWLRGTGAVIGGAVRAVVKFIRGLVLLRRLRHA